MIYFLLSSQLQLLLDVLKSAGYECIGPQVREQAIVYDLMEDVALFPWGRQDIQKPGSYRLKASNKKQAFGGWSNGSQSIKPWVFKSHEILWKALRQKDGAIEFEKVVEAVKPRAIIGLRACDLAALAIQDRILTQDQYVDENYKARREKLFLVAVNCTYSSDNCFCVSAIGGPKVTSGYDIEMTEIDEGFVLSAGSDAGEAIISQLKLDQASEEQIELSHKQIDVAVKTQTKTLPKGNLRDKLFSNLNHPQYEDIATRCLSCANCTQVCPTCFCHNEFDVPTLQGDESARVREWDSCFTRGHSYLNHAVLRSNAKDQYRQWLTHKLGSWFDQFGMSGCVGCGRCITWCPVGIDITIEANKICQEDEES